jgi:hypothetical protein
MFGANFTAYADGVSEAVRSAGPIAVDAGAGGLPRSSPGEG